MSFVLFCATARFNFPRRFSTSLSPNPASLSLSPLPLLAETTRRHRRRRAPLLLRCRQHFCNALENDLVVVVVIEEEEGQIAIIVVIIIIILLLLLLKNLERKSPVFVTTGMTQNAGHFLSSLSLSLENARTQNETHNANLRENPCVKVVSRYYSLFFFFFRRRRRFFYPPLLSKVFRRLCVFVVCSRSRFERETSSSSSSLDWKQRDTLRSFLDAMCCCYYYYYYYYSSLCYVNRTSSNQ